MWCRSPGAVGRAGSAVAGVWDLLHRQEGAERVAPVGGGHVGRSADGRRGGDDAPCELAWRDVAASRRCAQQRERRVGAPSGRGGDDPDRLVDQGPLVVRVVDLTSGIGRRQVANRGRDIGDAALDQCHLDVAASGDDDDHGAFATAAVDDAMNGRDGPGAQARPTAAGAPVVGVQMGPDQCGRRHDLPGPEAEDPVELVGPPPAIGGHVVPEDADPAGRGT